jgi:hypothetical protein
MRSMSSKFAVCAVLAAAVGFLIGVQPAQAATLFDFSYSFTTTDPSLPSGFTSASGVITATDLGGGTFLATKITGLWNGENITGLEPTGSEGNNDNLLFPTTYPVLDGNGITFAVAPGPGLANGDFGAGQVNVWYCGPVCSPPVGLGYTDYSYLTGFSPIFNLTATTPLPSTWIMLLSGFVGLGYFAYRGTKKNAAAIAAA